MFAGGGGREGLAGVVVNLVMMNKKVSFWRGRKGAVLLWSNRHKHTYRVGVEKVMTAHVVGRRLQRHARLDFVVWPPPCRSPSGQKTRNL